jgi:hypothetical protein
MTDPYRVGTKQLTQHPYRDGFIVWNWELNKWDYFGEELV